MVAVSVKKKAELFFGTDSEKIELFSQQLADAGFDPLPRYAEQPEPPPGFLRLLYGRSPLHTFGRTQNNEVLMDVDPSNHVWVNDEEARALGLRQGQAVVVENA